ncbi:hypothetical protein [Tabrizicola sp.]|jgi:hypothetical protein|uniref:hypothetical protein n=1 Tax=Tabrizicola sp. TaxID=2005166 RepID=UPI0035B22BA7
MKVAFSLLFLASPSGAEPWIDYELLFQQNADKIVVTTDAMGTVTRSIDLGDGVTVSCSDEGCIGVDMKGGVGCSWLIFSELLAVAEVCDLPKDQTANLTEFQRKQTAFIAENAVPPRSLAEVEGYHRQTVDLFRLGGAGAKPLDCKAITAPDSDAMVMLKNLSDSLAKQNLEDLNFEPRLPVMNPCF